MTETNKPTHIEIEGQLHPITWLEAIAMLGGLGGSENGKPGYDYYEIEIDGQPAGLFHLPPHSTTQIVKIIESVTCQDWPISGDAWALVQNKVGHVSRYNLPNNMKHNPITYSKGDIVVWGSHQTDAWIVTTYNKPFTDSSEKPLELSDPEVSVHFRTFYQFHSH